jgi:hypothetical protein
MGHGTKSSLDFISKLKSSLDFILLSQNRPSIGTAVCKWMDETVCRFAILSLYPSGFSLLPFPRIPYTPVRAVLLCCCALYSTTTEPSDSDPSLFSQSATELAASLAAWEGEIQITDYEDACGGWRHKGVEHGGV